ncbi:UDP-glycosyltransferase [uncultured Winogradskyella sp.]|uniref:UDP-glycosyltransferase n=1 Tax=uncultured Winogradskyella sp. TaxID=395353 RepID=UPI00351450B3
MSLNKYDLILANHKTTVDKLYKKGFVIQTCHGIYPSLEQPNPKANGFVSISQEVQDHLGKLGFPSILVHNSINLERFKPKKNINRKLKSVLSMCHSEKANLFIEDICEKLNLKYTEAYKYNSSIWDIENKINNSDLVVGLGRSAYEAMACGRPVLVYDDRKYFKSCGDGYIRDILGLSLKKNCSGRYFNKKFDELQLIEELRKYNYDDSAFFREFAKLELDVRKNIDFYLEYKSHINQGRRYKRKENIKFFINRLLGDKFSKKIFTLIKK